MKYNFFSTITCVNVILYLCTVQLFYNFFLTKTGQLILCIMNYIKIINMHANCIINYKYIC